MNGKTILVWFRNDLRVHDNEILLEAVKRSENIVPVYCFDPRYFTDTDFGTKKTGPFRAKFLLESVNGLRQSLQKLGGNLMVKIGMPEEILPQICEEYSISEVYHHREVAAEETEISEKVEAALWKQQINLKHFIGHTLYHKEDLPFPIKDIPDAFVTFKKKIERDSSVRPGFATPHDIKIPEQMELGDIPELSDLGLAVPQFDERAQYKFVGGEQEGLSRLADFLATHNTRQIKGNKNVTTITSLLSPWLSLGCLSPREVYWQVKNFDREHPHNDITAHIILELQWRDYFRFMLKKHGSKITSPAQGPVAHSTAYEMWKQGKTGLPVVDACMAELNSTGYINSKCRQYVAMHLVKDLGVDWRAGAAYFEEKLMDHSPSSNWGNWTYIAGEGVMSVNRPITIKADTFLEEQYIKKWMTKLNEVH